MGLALDRFGVRRIVFRSREWHLPGDKYPAVRFDGMAERRDRIGHTGDHVKEQRRHVSPWTAELTWRAAHRLGRRLALAGGVDRAPSCDASVRCRPPPILADVRCRPPPILADVRCAPGLHPAWMGGLGAAS